MARRAALAGPAGATFNDGWQFDWAEDGATGVYADVWRTDPDTGKAIRHPEHHGMWAGSLTKLIKALKRKGFLVPDPAAPAL